MVLQSACPQDGIEKATVVSVAISLAVSAREFRFNLGSMFISDIMAMVSCDVQSVILLTNVYSPWQRQP